MPSLESAADPTILDATGGTSMEDETCLEGPTMRCTPDEERALLNPLLTKSLNNLEDMPLGYLNVLAAHIDEIRKVKVSQKPVPLPRVLPGLPPPLPISRPPQPVLMPSEPSTTVSLSKAIYSATSNLGTTVPSHTQRTPTCPPDQAKIDQAMRVLEGINKSRGSMLDHSGPWSVP